MQDVAPTDRLQGRSANTAALSGNRAGGSLSVDRLGQIFSARELKAAFAAIAATTCSKAMSWSGWTRFQIAVGIALQMFFKFSFCRGVLYQRSNDS